MAALQVSFDAQSNVVYARFTVRPVDHSVRLDATTLVDVDVNGDLVGIEAVLGRTRNVESALHRYGIRGEDADQLRRLLDGRLDMARELARSRQQWHPEPPSRPAPAAELPHRIPGASTDTRPRRPGRHRSPWVRL